MPEEGNSGGAGVLALLEKAEEKSSIAAPALPKPYTMGAVLVRGVTALSVKTKRVTNPEEDEDPFVNALSLGLEIDDAAAEEIRRLMKLKQVTWSLTLEAESFQPPLTVNH